MPTNGSPQRQDTGIEWRKCDLFSLRDTEAALDNCDVAVYLVHSMMPQARLTQGKFEDIDLWLADNFARASANGGVRKIVYLSGIQPDKNASPHLKSREEVEIALGAYGTPVIALRAGMVLGQGGSSFVMMKRLVENLPIMICPAWTQTRSNPIDIQDVVEVISRVCLDDKIPSRSYDLGGPDTVTYLSMMQETAKVLGMKRLLIRFPYVHPGLSSLWVRLVTRSPKQLVNPLIMSLTCDMVPKDSTIWSRYNLRPKAFLESLVSAIRADRESRPIPQTSLGRAPTPGNLVVSIQRLPWARGMKPFTVMNQYFGWLRSAFGWFLRVRSTRLDTSSAVNEQWEISIAGILPALTFCRKSARCTDTREILEITTGLLAGQDDGKMPRFECRSTMGGEAILMGILDYKPRLPWRVYKYTQAVVHSLVMRAFSSR